MEEVGGAGGGYITHGAARGGEAGSRCWGVGVFCGRVDFVIWVGDLEGERGAKG